MAMDPAKMADEMHKTQGEDGDAPDGIKAIAAAVVAHVSLVGVVSNLPGTVTGTCPPGGPLAAGAASSGLIAGFAGPALATDMAARIGKGPATAQLIGLSSGIATHLLTGIASFTPGGITGTCTNTASSPGPVLGQGTKGKISGLDGDSMAELVAAGLGSGPATDKLKGMCGAITKHIMQNAEIAYITGSITGAAPPAGGPMTVGAGVGGKIT